MGKPKKKKIRSKPIQEEDNDETKDAIDQFVDKKHISLGPGNSEEESSEDALSNEVLPLDQDDLYGEDGDVSESKLEPKWGKRRSVYYNTDYVDSEIISSESEAEEEEQEVILLQRQKAAEQTPDDYIDIFGKSVFEPEKKITDTQSLSKTEKSDLFDIRNQLNRIDNKIDMEHVKRDTTGLTKKEKLEIVMNDSPELLKLLEIFKEVVVELEGKMDPLVQRIEKNSFPPSSGIEFLNLKFQLLLTCAININYYLLRKISGNSIRDHPVIRQLLRIRGMIDKLRPLDEKLQKTIDLILENINAENNQQEISSSVEEISESPVEEEEQHQQLLEHKKLQKEEEVRSQQKKVTQQEVLKEPDLTETMAEIAEYSELLRKESDKNKNAKKRSFLSMVDVLEKDSKNFQTKNSVEGGVEDASKRRKLEDVKSQSVSPKMTENSDKDEISEGSDDIVDDEYYQQIQKQQQQKKKQKQEKTDKIVQEKTLLPPEITDEQEEFSGKRKITTKMEKNISLKKKIKKQNKNPRVKHKLKYKKALVRRAGQIQKMRDKTVRYRGEKTGIKSNLVKSTPLY